MSSWSGTRQVLYSITKHAMRRSPDEIGATSISFRPKVFSDPASVVDVHRQSRQPRQSRSCFYPFLRDRHIEPTLPCRSVKASTRCWKHRVTAPAVPPVAAGADDSQDIALTRFRPLRPNPKIVLSCVCVCVCVCARGERYGAEDADVTARVRKLPPPIIAAG